MSFSVWAASDSRHSAMYCSTLKNGTTTLTRGAMPGLLVCGGRVRGQHAAAMARWPLSMPLPDQLFTGRIVRYGVDVTRHRA
ncbi:hypothetical protein GCM10010149_73420 [Nonomuraea roseoviolacea subsp. roseoviolacea]